LLISHAAAGSKVGRVAIYNSTIVPSVAFQLKPPFSPLVQV
jgi:hypothetical protein